MRRSSLYLQPLWRHICHVVALCSLSFNAGALGYIAQGIVWKKNFGYLVWGLILRTDERIVAMHLYDVLPNQKHSNFCFFHWTFDVVLDIVGQRLDVVVVVFEVALDSCITYK
ncbi:hypothetical protein IEQ34_002713 [Dendrobium chrysotoxum]|uniref:Secreted protein n=1 Tax=Dendrobium chrysotoxum TaxID=161865 RepID=A0AAV7HHR2_DENCH|nr:hypothetical protein IEQ34_002713 [Dendrobium chrysotoxum]